MGDFDGRDRCLVTVAPWRLQFGHDKDYLIAIFGARWCQVVGELIENVNFCYLKGEKDVDKYPQRMHQWHKYYPRAPKSIPNHIIL